MPRRCQHTASSLFFDIHPDQYPMRLHEADVRVQCAQYAELAVSRFPCQEAAVDLREPEGTECAQYAKLAVLRFPC